MTGFDPVGIIEVLARHGVDFVVIGGFAAELYRAPVPPTTDIDVTPSMTAPNLARLSAALYELGARIRAAEVSAQHRVHAVGGHGGDSSELLPGRWALPVGDGSGVGVVGVVRADV